jgi:thiol-disulfide isomerase/thioredoxin
MKERIGSDSSLVDSAELPFKYSIYKEKVDNDTLRAYFLGDLLSGHFQRPGDRDVKGLMNKLQDLPLPSHLKDSLKKDREEWKELLPGERSPGFAYPSIEGDTVSLADLKGDYVLVDTWASWCGPCKREIPHLEELQERFSDANISFVSISLDEKKTREDWEKMVKEKELKGHQLIANEEGFDSDFAEDHMISSIPRFLLFDPEGRIVDADAERPSGELGERLDTLLNGSPS